MLAHRLRRWPNIEPTHGQWPVLLGNPLSQDEHRPNVQLGHRPRRWSAIDKRFMFAGMTASNR